MLENLGRLKTSQAAAFSIGCSGCMAQADRLTGRSCSNQGGRSP
uniref:Uncharacterized protein n=1 Tax=Anguilla anguilla TaxID=7936 RepID=A0A0E9QP10_ANGAN